MFDERGINMIAKLTTGLAVFLIGVSTSGYCIGQDSGESGAQLVVATVCMNAKEDTAANLETFSDYIKLASEQGANLIVFPAVSLQGNPGYGTKSYHPTEDELQYVRESAETIPGASTDFLVATANQYNIYIVFGMTEKSDEGDLYNTSVLLGPTGIYGKYRKRSLSAFLNEDYFWKPGSEKGPIDSPLGKVGLMICADILEPFGANLAEQEADFLVTVTAWPSAISFLYEKAATQKASDAGLWHIVANQVDTVGHVPDYGRSLIINPYGQICEDTGRIEGMVIARTDIVLPFSVPVVDFNGNGTVDINDLLRIIESWNQDDPSVDIAPPPFGDGVVDILDLELLMSYWGQEMDDPTLMAHWALDEAEGTVAYDSVGINDAIVIGEPVWQPEDGKVGGALAFDGIDDYVFAQNGLNPADEPFSVLAWIQGGTPGQVVISQLNGANWLRADPTSGCLMTELCASGRNGVHLQSETGITDGNWHRVGFVWDGLNRSLYVDDILVTEDTQQELASSIGGLNIGCGMNSAAGTFWSGLIDDVRIYNRAVHP